MDTAEYRHLYTSSGFLWTAHLERFVIEHAGRGLNYPHPRTRRPVAARFCHLPLIRVGRGCGQHELTVDALGEEIAPVGDCSDGNIQLLLTESGRLVGFADYMLLVWSVDGVESDWRTSLARLLAGMEPEILGIIP